jgi:hypothetical protein
MGAVVDPVSYATRHGLVWVSVWHAKSFLLCLLCECRLIYVWASALVFQISVPGFFK